MPKKIYSFFLFILCIKVAMGQIELKEPSIENSEILQRLFDSASPLFKNVIANPETYKYQIVYTRVNRAAKGENMLQHHYYNFNPANYLYPASMVKFPTCMLALHKLETLKLYGITRNTPMITDSAYDCQTSAHWDFSQADSMPSIDAYIKKMMLVSDNDAYNRVYEFLGYDFIHQELKKKGYKDMRIVQRFEFPCDSLSYYNTNPVTFKTGNNVLYSQPKQEGKMRLRNPYGEVWMGGSYYNDEFLYPFPRSFLLNNFLPLDELHRMLIGCYLPQSLPANSIFKVSTENNNALKKYMGMWPKECSHPYYPLPDNYKKYILMGDGVPLPDNSDIRIFNVVGRAYGVLADCAYIVDFKNNVEFFVTAIMYVNENDILNDDDYEYNSIGLPFLGELGRMLYKYELKNDKFNSNIDLSLKKLFETTK